MWSIQPLSARFIIRICAILSGLGLMSSFAHGAETNRVVKLHLPGFSTNSLPFLIAEDLGFHKEAGIRVEITRVQTGSGVQALVAGALDASQIVGPTTLAAVLSGAPLKVVMVFNDKPTYKLYVKKQFKRFADLKGAKLGGSTPGSTNDRLLKIVLERNGIDWRKDLSIIYIGTSDVMLKSLQSGAIDGAAMTPPASFLAEEFGFYPLANFISEIGALQGGVTINSNFLNARRDIAERFLASTLKGLTYLRSDRSGTVGIMTKFLQLSWEKAARVYDESLPTFVANGIIPEDFQDRVLDFELKTIGTDKKISRDRIFDFAIMKTLASK
jgi:NitT/TauT family transport system substrate-binding protein